MAPRLQPRRRKAHDAPCFHRNSVAIHGHPHRRIGETGEAEPRAFRSLHIGPQRGPVAARPLHLQRGSLGFVRRFRRPRQQPALLLDRHWQKLLRPRRADLLVGLVLLPHRHRMTGHVDRTGLPGQGHHRRPRQPDQQARHRQIGQPAPPAAPTGCGHPANQQRRQKRGRPQPTPRELDHPEGYEDSLPERGCFAGQQEEGQRQQQP